MTVVNETKGKAGSAGINIAGECTAGGVVGNHTGKIKEVKHLAAGEWEFVLEEEAPHGYTGMICGTILVGTYQVLASTKTTIKFKLVNKENIALDTEFNFLIIPF